MFNINYNFIYLNLYTLILVLAYVLDDTITHNDTCAQQFL